MGLIPSLLGSATGTRYRESTRLPNTQQVSLPLAPIHCLLPLDLGALVLLRFRGQVCHERGGSLLRPKATAVASPLVRLGPGEGQLGVPTPKSARRDSLPGVRGTRPRLGPRAPWVPSGNLSDGSSHPRAPLTRAASRNQPLSQGSLRAKGIFLWILLEAVAARRASPHPPESWRLRSPQRGARCPEPRTAAPRARSSLAERPRASPHSPQGLDRTCPVSLPSSGARAAIRARLPAPPPPLSARRRGERQQVTRHLAKNTGSLRRAQAPARTLRPPALQPASQPAANGISSFSLHYVR